MLAKKMVSWFTLVLLIQTGFAQTLENSSTVQRAIEQLSQQAQEAAKSRDHKLAMLCYKKVFDLDPSRTDIFDTIAKMYYDAKSYTQAFEAYLEKIQMVKPSERDYFYMGNCQMQLKNFPMADSMYAKVNELNPTYAIGWYTRARINVALDMDNERKTRAKPFYQKYLELVEPTFDKTDVATKRNVVTAYAYLVEYYFASGESQNLAKAVEYGKKVEMLAPDYYKLVVCGGPRKD
ncbi:tetratricopeptide repeat protein [Haliscomenobacter sp.]|uniref:tetratricopeptide repeat protein n=1 Tax=Haliscomenobacter sp. TaxID=2717303 RepID=UPI003BA9C69E